MVSILCLDFQFISRCVVGASLEEPEEEDDARSTTSSIIASPKEGCYEVVGTVKDRDAPKPDFMKEVIKVRDMYSYIVFIKSTWKFSQSKVNHE